MLQTIAEQSGFRQTGRLDEVEALSEAFVARWPGVVRSFSYGQSAEGRPMRALIVSRAGALTPQAVRAGNIPLVMLQGGIRLTGAERVVREVVGAAPTEPRLVLDLTAVHTLDDVSQWILALGKQDTPEQLKEKLDQGKAVINYGLYAVYRQQDWAQTTNPSSVTNNSAASFQSSFKRDATVCASTD